MKQTVALMLTPAAVAASIARMPAARGRELDLHVRGEAREPQPLLEHALGVRVVRRVGLDRQPALAPALADEHRLEHGRTADRHLLDHRPGDVGLGPRRVGRGQLA